MNDLDRALFFRFGAEAERLRIVTYLRQLGKSALADNILDQHIAEFRVPVHMAYVKHQVKDEEINEEQDDG